MHLDASVEALLGEARKVRRCLHKIPETGYQERKTQAFILDYLQKLSPDSVEKIADTGVKAVFYAEHATGSIAFRADMDALGIHELNECEYSSQHPGFMHACGHDGHMTVLLLLARLISKARKSLYQNVVLLFQPAEEGIGGAKRMIEEGALENPGVERIFGLHVWPEVELGRVGFREGPMMAQTCEFDIEMTGKSAHAASPHLGVDAIVAASEFISMLQSIITRSINPRDKALVSIGHIVGGEKRNVIAEKVVLNGTLRTFSNSVTKHARTRILEVLEGLERASGIKAQFREVLHYPVLENPVHMAEYLAEIMGYDDIDVVDENMAAEDFSFYQQKVPGMYFFLGVGTPEHTNPLHSNLFDFDERALLYGVEIFRRILCLESASFHAAHRPKYSE